MSIKLYARIADNQTAIQVSGKSRQVRLTIDILAFDQGDLQDLRQLIGDLAFSVTINEGDDGGFIPVDDRSGEQPNGFGIG